ncbi:ABC transporter ATP-binding protein [Picrophilus oshimae]|uniref:Dipeptide ABC transporter Dpp1, ATP binding protein n=1 Tax=Picrophilus torridus (strain ATCC 700027 / DSM 9790 / JCM 10055 / NBRC 100828 / KAW 2/3) TaxID=1122961 RepID=Q6L2K2_PICTO|nr:ABC transporter ATP-binding protein [Picrophilus oshimae]AAT42800.1 dipeptide ABC transporter Dpp1, ATP binding protein [Picrophilus oshimae DSM 9789]
MLLEIKNLNVSYKTVNGISNVLNNFELSMDAGDIISIVGESGSGKSTLGGAITKLLPPSAIETGSVIVDGKDIVPMSESEITNMRGTTIFMIFQNPLNSLNPVKTVGYQLMEAARVRNDRSNENLDEEAMERLVIDTLRSMRLPDPEKIMKRYPHELSGGQVQRIVISMALILRPKLLIADEPTTALDVTIQAQVINLLKELNRDYKMSIIFITHDLSLAYSISNRIMVMYAGRIMELNDSEEIIKNPKHPYTIALLLSVPTKYKTETKLYYISGSPPSFFNLPAGCKFNPRCEKAFDKCREMEPDLIVSKGNSRIRCWLYE